MSLWSSEFQIEWLSTISFEKSLIYPDSHCPLYVKNNSNLLRFHYNLKIELKERSFLFVNTIDNNVLM